MPQRLGYRAVGAVLASSIVCWVTQACRIALRWDGSMAWITSGKVITLPSASQAPSAWQAEMAPPQRKSFRKPILFSSFLVVRSALDGMPQIFPEACVGIDQVDRLVEVLPAVPHEGVEGLV